MDILDKERLKECRLKLGITKQEAAKRVQISQPAYLRYEAGSRNPSIQTIAKMAEVFSTSTDYLVGKSADPTPNRIVVVQNESPSSVFSHRNMQKPKRISINTTYRLCKSIIKCRSR